MKPALPTVDEKFIRPKESELFPSHEPTIKTAPSILETAMSLMT